MHQNHFGKLEATSLWYVMCDANQVASPSVLRGLDYRSQGQTITYVLVDIAPPPSGTLSLF